MAVRVRPSRITTPLLVLVRCATIRAYKAEAAFFPNMGHNMMLEPGWADVALSIQSWLATLRL